MTAGIALLGHRDPDDILGYGAGRERRVGQFLADVDRLAAQLPARRHVMNFCAERYCFAVGLAAALCRGQVTLLPPNQAPELLRQLAQAYPGLYTLTDVDAGDGEIEQLRVCPADDSVSRPPASLAFAPEATAVIAFTSGSTGQPMANPKLWGALARGAHGEGVRFGLQHTTQTALVGTVPPQHMYGLESTVLLALHNGLAVHGARPFYPADVRAALLELPCERVLITTPVHLRALLSENIDLPPLRLAVCATAPLAAELAAQFEARYGTELHEVYGFTEAGMVATRRTVQDPTWHALPDVRIRESGAQVLVGGGHITDEVAFSDIITLIDEQHFELHGRSADLLNVAGKRTSLGFLNHQLASIAGVTDAVFFMPDESDQRVTRLTAFVVAPALSREQLSAALRERIDAAFLPRPLYFVDSLPHNASGKLPRESLRALAARCTHELRQRPVEIETAVAPDHPALAGHFPGDPVVPGVVLLDEVISAAQRGFALTAYPCTIKATKFLRPVRPGERMLLRLVPVAEHEIRFECRVGGELAASGIILAGIQQAAPGDAA
ncbi:MAG: AMP-binding protein [Burkholderiales bacterium]